VWTYLFEETEIPLVCNNADVHFSDAVATLPAVRKYQRIDELGHDFFRLQCYFVTHFIYVLSDWGRHVLERALFEEEFVISMDDPELTGEFLQCLRILGVSQNTRTCSTRIWSLILQAMTYLLGVERRHGGGMWSKSSDGPYDRYHTTYCAIVGLLSFEFHASDVDDGKLSPPNPRAFYIRRSTPS